MDEYIYLIVVSILVVILLVALFFVKKSQKYIDGEYQHLLENSDEYLKNISLKDGKYLEKVKTHGASITYKLNSDGDFDYISNLSLKKNYAFLQDRVVYIFNDNWKTKVEIKVIDNKEYYVLNNQIDNVNILLSFERSQHILARYIVKKVNQEFILVVDEKGVDLNEEN